MNPNVVLLRYKKLSNSFDSFTVIRNLTTNQLTNLLAFRLDFDEFNIAQPFTCGGSSSSVACTTADGPKIGDCIYDSMTITTPGILYTSNENKNMENFNNYQHYRVS